MIVVRLGNLEHNAPLPPAPHEFAQRLISVAMLQAANSRGEDESLFLNAKPAILVDENNAMAYNLATAATRVDCCPKVGSARGSREPGQAGNGAAISGVLLCGVLFWAESTLSSDRSCTDTVS